MEKTSVAEIARKVGLDPGKLELLAEASGNAEQTGLGVRADYAARNRWLHEYYPDSDLNRAHLTRASFLIDGQSFSTWIVSDPNWRGLRISTESGLEKAAFVDAPSPCISISEEDIAVYVARILKSGAKNWDDKIYRLLSSSFAAGEASMEFAEDSFLRYRFTFGLMTDELDHHIARGSHIDHCRDDLELRRRWLPAVDQLRVCQERICAGGVNVLVVIAQPRPECGYVALLDRRSQLVSEGQGGLSLVPMGYHQPMQNSFVSVAPAFSVFRELYQELFGGEKDIHRKPFGRPQFFYRGNRALEWLRSHPAGFDLVLNAFGINLLQGNYEFAYTLVIDDTDFWQDFGPEFVTNWESGGLEILSLRDHVAVRKALNAAEWAGSALMTFVEGLKFLAETRPDQITLPPGIELS